MNPDRWNKKHKKVDKFGRMNHGYVIYCEDLRLYYQWDALSQTFALAFDELWEKKNRLQLIGNF